MKTSEIKFIVELDNQNIPEIIYWDATENPAGNTQETRAIALSLWDHHERSTMKIGLWSKEMPAGEMKRFYIETIGGLADSLLTATGDRNVSEEIHILCTKPVSMLEEDERKGR